MPMDRSRYPKNWPEISNRIRFGRAHGRCEKCGAEYGKPHPVTGSIVVLTVAHLGVPKPDGAPGDKHDKMDCRDENLGAYCQLCHLNYDRDEHMENARRTREKQRRSPGQLSLLEHSELRQRTENVLGPQDDGTWLEATT